MIVSEMYTQRETETRRKTKLEGREREPNTYKNTVQVKVAYSTNASFLE